MSPTGIPMDSAKTATAVRAGCLRSIRTPSFTSSADGAKCGIRMRAHATLTAEPKAFRK